MHVCLFDIDGTLLASGGAGKAAVETALCEEFQVEMRGRVSYSGRTDRAIVRDLFEMHGLQDNVANWQRLREGYLRRLPACLAQHNGTVLPGIKLLLEGLAEHPRVTLGLLTGNIRDGARIKLGHFGLEHHFAFGGYGDHHFDRDEVAREALAEARRHLNGQVANERIWVIGDTPLDIRCARAIGARVAAVATGWHSLAELEAAKPDLLFPHLEDAGALLKLLE
ncbi:MAG: HAD family hydrolase [Planctomycetes bacterium]|nr:HAD family hydrolase [Planctomycetota bacterium]